MSNLKYLYANGESWTEGVKFDEETGILQDQRWSKLLSDKLGLIEINESEGGGSNDRMVRTTIEWFDNNPDKWDEVLVILGFIEPIRMEYWDEVDNNWCQWNAKDMDNNIFGDKKWWKKYVTTFLNDVTLHHNLKNQILLLTSFFDSNNIKYLMFFSWGAGMIVDSYPHGGFEIYKTINTKYFLRDRFRVHIENKIGFKKAITECEHASVDGHKIWTEKLYKELKDRKVT
tara:strand:+ start:159 stop:848 length:690 start_codon:yes stop_codon:yes gene_type:complete